MERKPWGYLRQATAAGDPYDLVIWDMQMPEMDGRMLAQAIREEPALSSTRLLLLISRGKRHETSPEDGGDIELSGQTSETIRAL